MDCTPAISKSHITLNNFNSLKNKYRRSKVLSILHEIKYLNNKQEYSKSQSKLTDLNIKLAKISVRSNDFNSIIEIVDTIFKNSQIKSKINNANLQNPSLVVDLINLEIVKLIINTEQDSNCEFLQRYPSITEESFSEIVNMALATENSWKVLAAIQNFKFRNEENLQALVDQVISSDKNHRLLPKKFKEYGINNQKLKIAIAKCIAQHDPRQLARDIRKYGIEDFTTRYEIACFIAQRDGFGISVYIPEFNIPEEEQRIEIAKHAARQDGYGPSMYLENYEITDQTALCEIAELSAQANGMITSYGIRSYNIEDRNHLFKIVKLAIQENPEKTFVLFENYGITNPSHLNEIAALFLKTSTLSFNEILELLTMRIDTVKEALHGNLEETLDHLTAYNINNPHYLYEVAKVVVELGGKIILEYIDKFETMYVKDRIEIAKLLAKQIGKELTKNIEVFQIDTILHQNDLVDIARIALESDPVKTSAYIHLYDIQDPLNRFQLFLYGFGRNQLVAEYIKQYYLFSFIPLSLYTLFLGETSFEVNMRSLKNFCRLQWPQVDFSPLFKTIEDPTDAFVQQKHFHWLLYTCALCSDVARGKNQSLSSDEMQWMCTSGLLECIVKLRDPPLRYTLTDYLVSMCADKKQRQCYKDLVSDKDFSYVKQSHLFLVCLALHRRKTDGKALSKKIKNTKHIFKDSTAKKVLLDTLFILTQDNTLSNSSKMHLLHIVFEKVDHKQDLLSKLNAIQGIISMGCAADLQKEALLEGDHYDLSAVHMKAFQRKLGVRDIENFTERYNQTFGKFRAPDALFLYLNRLSLLPFKKRKKVVLILAEFCESVLLNTFKSKRYDQTSCPHLKIVFDGREKLKEEWQKGASYELESFLDQENVHSDVTVKYIIQNLHDHICALELQNPEDYSFVMTYINAKEDEAARKENWSLLKNELRNLKVEKIINNKLKIQEILIQLLNPKMDAKRKGNQLRLLREILKTLPDYNPLAIEIEKTIEKCNFYKNWTIVDTDDPCDLLLCGSEIKTCQHVNGNPLYNRALPAYLMEGKNRLIAVKDANGRIRARCILRLLWDSMRHRPVLLKEGYYPQFLELDALLSCVLDAMCIERAKALNLKLISIERSRTQYEGEVRSFGGRSPYEYVDAIENLVKGCEFLIDKQLYEIKT